MVEGNGQPVVLLRVAFLVLSVDQIGQGEEQGFEVEGFAAQPEHVGLEHVAEEAEGGQAEVDGEDEQGAEQVGDTVQEF
jgi:hypothetical protein